MVPATGKEGAMKTGLLAVLLTCALVSAAGAATVTMTPPDLQNQQAVKPSVQPQVRTEPLPQLAAPSPRVMEAKRKVVATSPAPVAQPKPQTAAKPKVVATPLPQVMDAKPKVVAAPSTRTAQPQTKFQNRLVQRDVHRRRLARRAPRPGSGTYDYAAAAPFRWQGQWAPAAPIVSPGDEGLRIEDRGWTGGVGNAPDGGGGGFVDGYGQVHFANGAENGPTYNSYGQSFQPNPSQAGPFQPRLMGGLAPPSR